jgi:anthranilate/para-aminobenzoate synthase component I
VTASGIPKEAAFRYIRTHESERRGLYSGAVLAIDHDGSLDAALVLRSLYRKQGRSWLQAGAGIVAQSTPAREFEETCEKLNSVARFLVPRTSSGDSNA